MRYIKRFLCRKMKVNKQFPDSKILTCCVCSFPHEKIRWNYGIFRSDFRRGCRVSGYSKLDLKDYVEKTCSESCQTSKMALFAKLVDGWNPLTIFAKSSILDVWQGSENAFDVNWRSTYYREKHSLSCFNGGLTKLTFTCSKVTIETLRKGVKYVQS